MCNLNYFRMGCVEDINTVKLELSLSIVYNSGSDFVLTKGF